MVGLEENLIIDRGADKLGALRGAEQHSAVLDDEVHRKDFRATVDTGDQPPQRHARQQNPKTR